MTARSTNHQGAPVRRRPLLASSYRPGYHPRWWTRRLRSSQTPVPHAIGSLPNTRKLQPLASVFRPEKTPSVRIGKSLPFHTAAPLQLSPCQWIRQRVLNNLALILPVKCTASQVPLRRSRLHSELVTADHSCVSPPRWHSRATAPSPISP